MRRFKLLAGGLLLVCPFCAGCLGAYAYPTAHYIPSAVVGKPEAATVHAFRVDILDTGGSIDFSEVDEYDYREIDITATGIVPAQRSIGVGRGWWALLGKTNYTQRLHPTIRVRLYRSGYETVNLKPWQRAGKVEWNPAATPEARESAIDDLISTRDTDEYFRIAPEFGKHKRADYGLAAPASDAQRAALLFIAGEYDRLVSDAATRGDGRATERLMEKGRLLRTLALE